MRVEAVLFDLFDTLLLIEGGEAFYMPSLKKLHEFLLKNDIKAPFEEFAKAYFEIRDKLYSESREALNEPHFNVRVSQTLKKLGYNIEVNNPIVAGATASFAEEFMRYIGLDDEAASVLQKLHGKYKLGLVSNLAIPECGWKLLEKFDLRKYFNVVLISGEINKRKPSREIFEKALKELGVDARKAVFVGDMLDLDVAGPKKVGMKTILIKRRRGNTEAEENLNFKPDKTITRLSELPHMLEDC
jgi:putative hydrolase of the HAD superfamily